MFYVPISICMIAQSEIKLLIRCTFTLQLSLPVHNLIIKWMCKNENISRFISYVCLPFCLTMCHNVIRQRRTPIGTALGAALGTASRQLPLFRV